jgi:hypothetical protein
MSSWFRSRSKHHHPCRKVGTPRHPRCQALPTKTSSTEQVPGKPAKSATPRKRKAAVSKPSQPQVKKTTNKIAAKKASSKSPSPSSESDSPDSSEVEAEIPEEPSPLPPIRPEDPEKAAEYDALQAVWSPRNRRPNIDKVKNALVAFKDVVKAIRDEWKAQSQAMKEAENKAENDKAAELKKNVVLQRRLVDVVVNATLEKGHPMIVEKYVLFLFNSYILPTDHCHCRRCRSPEESYYQVILKVHQHAFLFLFPFLFFFSSPFFLNNGL